MNEKIRQSADEVRDRLEAGGYILSDLEYEAILRYSIQKARANGKGNDYIPLLLEDEIKNYYFRNAINTISEMSMALA